MATNDNATKTLGKALVAKSDMIVVESFLQDRPPPTIDVEQEEAEIRIGQKADFQYDLTVGSDKNRNDFVIKGPKFGGVTWPDPPPTDEEEEEEPQDRITTVTITFPETNREIETIRVEGSDGESWVDVQRITSITFQAPDRQGPTGTIREFWKFNLNWGSPVINGVDTSTIQLNEGDTIVAIEDA